jgi:hypothetical protein
MSGLCYFCRGYVAVLVVATLADTAIAFATSYGDRSGIGCNFYDALLVGIECRGFPGSSFVELVLNFPLLLAYVSAFMFSSPLMLVPAVLLWFPVLYLVRRAFKAKNSQPTSP